MLFRDSSTWMGPVDVKQGREALAGREDHPAGGGTCRVPVAGNCLVSPCPLGPGAPPKTTTSGPPSTLQGAPLQPLSSLQGLLLFPGQVLGHPGGPPPFRVPLYSPVSSPLQGPCPLWALIPQPGALSTLWTGPPPSGTLSLPSSSFLLPGAPSILQDPSPSRITSKGTHCPRRSCDCRREGRQSRASKEGSLWMGRKGESIWCSPTHSAPGSLLETQVYPLHPEARSTAETWVESRPPATPYTEALQRFSQFG